MARKKKMDCEAEEGVAVVKKYANRRLYNTASSSYVTLDDLSKMVRDGEDFVVYDAKTGEDLTRSILTQIILEEDGKGRNLLPTSFLRQLIRFYDDSLRAFLPIRVIRAFHALMYFTVLGAWTFIRGRQLSSWK